MLACGDGLLGLRDLRWRDRGPVPFAGLNLEVDELDPAIAKVEANGVKLIEVRKPEPGAPVRLGVLLDPNGNGFELRQPTM